MIKCANNVSAEKEAGLVLGVDVVSVPRLRDLFVRTPGVEHRLFTPLERAYCSSRFDPLVHYAGTLAAKEAVMKALKVGGLPHWCQRIEIHRSPDGSPRAVVSRQTHSFVVQVSIAHAADIAIACALAGFEGLLEGGS